MRKGEINRSFSFLIPFSLLIVAVRGFFSYMILTLCSVHHLEATKAIADNFQLSSSARAAFTPAGYFL